MSKQKPKDIYQILVSKQYYNDIFLVKYNQNIKSNDILGDKQGARVQDTFAPVEIWALASLSSCSSLVCTSLGGIEPLYSTNGL